MEPRWGGNNIKTGKKEIFINTLYRPNLEQQKEIDNGFIILSNNQSTFGKYNKYPYTFPLYRVIAKNEKCGIENILLTRGAEEALKIIYETYAQPETYVLRANPTFGLVFFFEELNKVKQLLADYTIVNSFPSILLHDLSINYKSKISLVYIAMPDNPCGAIIDHNILEKLINVCEENNIKVILDLVYYSYYTGEAKKYNEILNSVYERENLILVNSFSKSHGLAGIRSGYIISNKNIISTLSKLRPIQEVNSVAVKETIEAIKSNIVRKNVKHCNYWKNKFKKIFTNYIESHGNFILLKYHNNEEHNIYNELYERKILTRINFDHDVMKGIIRIGIGKNKTMKKIMRIINDENKRSKN